ncbi:hypothetical protein Trydic_g15179 [Trypoxylus dichotomus]
MESGVPQCPALNPALFTIYTKNFPKPEDHRVFNAIYADDTAITCRYAKITPGLTQAHPAKIEEFSCTLGLKINSRKTQAIAFTRI